LLVLLISTYCGLIFFFVYRVLKNINSHRRVETISMFIQSGFLAYLIGILNKDVGNILIIISTLLLILYVIFLITKKYR